MKAFLLEYEKLCRKHGIAICGSRILPIRENSFLRWHTETPQTMGDYKDLDIVRQFKNGGTGDLICSVYFEVITQEMLKKNVYLRDFYYLQNGEVKQFKKLNKITRRQNVE